MRDSLEHVLFGAAHEPEMALEPEEHGAAVGHVPGEVVDFPSAEALLLGARIDLGARSVRRPPYTRFFIPRAHEDIRRGALDPVQRLRALARGGGSARGPGRLRRGIWLATWCERHGRRADDVVALTHGAP